MLHYRFENFNYYSPQDNVEYSTPVLHIVGCALNQKTPTNSIKKPSHRKKSKFPLYLTSIGTQEQILTVIKISPKT